MEMSDDELLSFSRDFNERSLHRRTDELAASNDRGPLLLPNVLPRRSRPRRLSPEILMGNGSPAGSGCCVSARSSFSKESSTTSKDSSGDGDDVVIEIVSREFDIQDTTTAKHNAVEKQPAEGNPTNGGYSVQDGRPSVAGAKKRAAQLELMTNSFHNAPKRNLEIAEPPSSAQVFFEEDDGLKPTDIWTTDTSQARSPTMKRMNSETRRRRNRDAGEEQQSDMNLPSQVRSGSLARVALTSRSMSSQRFGRSSMTLSHSTRISISNGRGRSGAKGNPTMTKSMSLNNRCRSPTSRSFRFDPSVVREPKIVLIPWGDNWSMDSLTLFNNAIRVEIKDMYIILKSIGRSLMWLTPDHIRRFYAWFSTFRELVSRAFEYQHLVILAKLSVFMPLSNGLDDDDVLEQQRSVLLYMDKVERLQNEFLVKENQRAFIYLVLACHDFSDAALKLFTILEEGLPVLIRAVSRGPAMASDIKQYLRKCSKASMLLPLLTRPMSGEKSASWLTSTVGGTWRLRWHYWYGNVEKTHFKAVEYFEKQNPDLEMTMLI